MTSARMITEIADETLMENRTQQQQIHHRPEKIRVTLRPVPKQHTRPMMNDKKLFITINLKIVQRADPKRNVKIPRKNAQKNRTQIDDLKRRKKIIEKNNRHLKR